MQRIETARRMSLMGHSRPSPGQQQVQQFQLCTKGDAQAKELIRRYGLFKLMHWCKMHQLSFEK
jgi:hypothetical protein